MERREKREGNGRRREGKVGKKGKGREMVSEREKNKKGKEIRNARLGKEIKLEVNLYTPGVLTKHDATRSFRK